MASTSESTKPTPSKPELKSNYHVFLSFRGLDTRKKFTDHLYKALKNEGFQTFRDDDEIERGEVIKSELLKSIRNSRMSVIVLSKNYSNSTACLLELQTILEQCKKTDHSVLPVFYEVDPQEIKKQAKKLDFGEKKVTEEEVEGWSEALIEVSRMAGHVFPDQTNGYEAKFIEEIVCVLKRKLLVGKHMTVSDHLVNMDSRIERVNSWLRYSSTRVGILLISGMGGIGKTTIAKVSYNSNHHTYDAACFLQNVREVAKEPNGLVHLQRQVLSSISRKGERKVNDVDDGHRRMELVLRAKRVLLVLDDVDHMDQLIALVGKPDWFSPGSKIIITTRLESVMNDGEIYEVYKPEKLCNCASLKLFSWHAFGRKHPIESHIALSKRFVQHCDGLPLALEVLGSAVRGKTTDFWEGKLQNLDSTSDNKILQKLEISYNSIEDDRDEELFLDIACFFIGKKKSDAITILDGQGYSALAGIYNLVDRNLLTIENEKLGMHQLLQDLGKQIVCRESTHPEDRTRIWHPEESFDILREKIGTNKIEGLMLDVHKLTNPNMNVFETNTFEKMYNLRLLTLCGVQLSGTYKAFPKRLVWLHWRHFPSESFPNDFPLEKLVALDLRYSNLKRFWTGSKVLGSLKILNLSHSPKLAKTPDFSRIPNLEKLILKACPTLTEVDESIVKLQRVQLLNLRDCKNLRKLPRNISTVESLVEMDISGCSNLMGAIEELEKMKSLQVLNASRVDIDGFLTKEVLWQGFIWPWVLKKRVTSSLASLASSLVGLNLSHCKLTEDAFPRDLSNLSQLQRLSLAGNPISSQPNFIKDLTGLLRLDLSSCSKLRQITWLSTGLEMLDVENCQALETIIYEDLPSLEEIKTLDCVNLNYVRRYFKIFPVRDMDVELLNRIGFFNLDSMADVEAFFFNHFLRSRKKLLPVQIMYEEGMYTTFYPGGEVPHWFSSKSSGSTISFTVTSSPDHFRLKGLNLCLVYTFPDTRQFFVHPLEILINNKSSGEKTAHLPGCFGVQKEGGDMVWLCHCFLHLFTVGDEVEVSFWISDRGQIKECGVHLMYFEDEGERLQYCRTMHSWDIMCSCGEDKDEELQGNVDEEEDKDEAEDGALILARYDRTKEEYGGADEQVNIAETGEAAVLMAEVIMAKEDE